jgi:hypothetical protein
LLEHSAADISAIMMRSVRCVVYPTAYLSTIPNQVVVLSEALVT